MCIDEITTSDTPEINAMKAEFYKLKCSLDSALHLQNFLLSTDLANSLMTVLKACTHKLLSSMTRCRKNDIN